MPMAISFVGAGVIWKFIYDYRGTGDHQIGLLNAIIVSGDGAASMAHNFNSGTIF